MVFNMRLICLAVVLVVVANLSVDAVELFVAPGGSDKDPGTADQPFASLPRAVAAARAANPAGGNIIWLRAGDYALLQTLELTAADSGLTIRGEANHQVILSGSRRLAAGDFKPVTDAGTLARLRPAANGHVVELDLAALGIRHRQPYLDVFADNGNLVDLFFNGARMPLARFPNAGYMTMKRVLDNAGGLTNRNWGSSTWEDVKPKSHGGTFEYREDFYSEHARWAKVLDRGVWLKGFWRIPWQNEAIRVKSIDVTNHTVTFAKPIAGGIGNKYTRPSGNGKEAYWLLNLLESIDQPGEWCVDFPAGKLYFYPLAPLENAAIAMADNDQPVIRVTGATNVTLRQITVENALGHGIEIVGGENNLVAGGTVRNVDKYAIALNGGFHHKVLSCDLYNLGMGGVWLAGGDDKAMPRVPAGHEVINNHIHHFSQITRIYAPAVHCGYVGGSGVGHYPAVGMLVAHNLIHDTPHAGVLSGSFDSVFEYNEVFRFALVSDDIGAFYCYDNYQMDGHRTFRYNLVHDSGEGEAFYFDMDHRDMQIYGNLVCLKSSGKHGCGLIFKDGSQKTSPPQNSVVTNNVFMRCATAGLVFNGDKSTNRVENNAIIQCRQLFDWRRYADGKWIKTTNTLPVENVLYATNPGFADPEHLNFRLKDDSTIRHDLPGFNPIPVEKIGLFVDEYRKQLPTDEEIDRFSSDSKEINLNADILDRK